MKQRFKTAEEEWRNYHNALKRKLVVAKGDIEKRDKLLSALNRYHSELLSHSFQQQ
jgi:hypothetical protein